MFTPNEHQIDIEKAFIERLNWLLLNARAGTGKTTTLLNLLPLIPKNKKVIFCAFNKSIQLELKDKCPSWVEVKTLHGKGAEICYHAFPKIKDHKKKVDPNKTLAYLDKKFNSQEGEEHLDQVLGTERESTQFIYKINIVNIYNYMRLNLVMDLEGVESLVDRYGIILLADEVYQAMELYSFFQTASPQNMDFTDMLWLPYIKKVKTEEYDYVFVDECQDLSRVQIELVLKFAGSKGRVVFCGDPKQQLYAFASADIESWNRISSFPNIETLPLGYNYRCGLTIIQEAKTLVPEIEAGLTHDGIVRRDGTIDEIKKGDFVLCRNNAPLVPVYIELIKKKIPCVIKGAEVGQDLINLCKRVSKGKIHSPTQIVLTGLYAIYSAELSKMTQRGVPMPQKSTKLIALLEKIKIVKTVIGEFKPRDISGLIRELEEIFSDKIENKAVLSTIHKSKGLENPRVFFYLPQLLPSPFATKEWERQGEINLKYVAITRAKNELIYIYKEVGGKEDIESDLDELTGEIEAESTKTIND